MANIPLKTITFPGLPDVYTIPSVDDTNSIAGAAADAAETGRQIGLLNESLDDVTADVGEGKTAYVQVMNDETEEEQDVETDTECTKDSEIFTESRNGYINSNGIISGGEKTQHKSFSFQTSVDCKIYVTHTKTYYIGIYNTAPYVSGNLVHRTGSTYQNNPTAENPYSVSAGQYIVISMYNDTTLAFGFTLHYITTQSGQVVTPTVIGALKTRTLALETASEAMQDDIDDLKTVKMPWEYAIDHVLCIGDSLTFGSPADSSTMPYPISQNYPYYLGRMLGLSGDVTNGGVPNYGAKTYYNSKFSDFTLTDYNTFIIFLGTNSGLTDTLDTDVDPYEDSADFADTNTGCYCKMIREIYDAVPNAIIVLVNTWHVAVVQPDTRTTIDKIGTKYGLPVVETYGVMRYGVNPVYHGGVDDVHCSKAGYLALANLIKDKLYEYFSADISRVNKGMS